MRGINVGGAENPEVVAHNLLHGGIAASTRTSYAREDAKMLVFFNTKYPGLIVNPLFGLDDTGVATERSYLNAVNKGVVYGEDVINPILFDNITIVHFVAYLQNRRKVGLGTLNQTRSAFKFLFTQWSREDVYKRLEPDLTKVYKSLKKEEAKMIQEGLRTIRKGVLPLPIELHNALGLIELQSHESKYVFSHCVSTLSWGLMCRVNNGVTINLSHLGWKNDALTIVFGRQKNDQCGERNYDRHIYANPLAPALCPVLALGIYFLVTELLPESEDGTVDSKLFPGSLQQARYTKIRNCMFTEQSALLKEFGLEPKDLGTHSTRKGAITYVSNGTTSSPSASSIHIRAGWTMEGMFSVYAQYEKAGDQFTGRVLSGLPLTHEFAMLPAAFSHEQHHIVAAIMKDLFPKLIGRIQLYPVLSHCLAAVVTHDAWLREHLPTAHPLFLSPLYVNRGMRKVLANCLDANPMMKDTGVPPFVSMQCQMNEFKTEIKADYEIVKRQTYLAINSQKESIKEIKQIILSVPTKMMERLEENHMSIDGVPVFPIEKIAAMNLERENAISLQLQKMQETIDTLVNAGDNNNNAPNPIVQDVVEVEPQLPLEDGRIFDWGTHYSLVPKDFTIPRTPRACFLFYLYGNPSKNIRPLKDLTTHDVGAGSNAAKRVSEYLLIMKDMCTELQRNQKWIAKEDGEYTNGDCDSMFDSFMGLIKFPQVSGRGRKRRANQMAWRTFGRQARKILKCRWAEEDAAEEPLELEFDEGDE